MMLLHLLISSMNYMLADITPAMGHIIALLWTPYGILAGIQRRVFSLLQADRIGNTYENFRSVTKYAIFNYLSTVCLLDIKPHSPILNYTWEFIIGIIYGSALYLNMQPLFYQVLL